MCVILQQIDLLLKLNNGKKKPLLVANFWITQIIQNKILVWFCILDNGQ